MRTAPDAHDLPRHPARRVARRSMNDTWGEHSRLVFDETCPAR